MRRMLFYIPVIGLLMAGCAPTFQSTMQGLQRMFTPTVEIYRQRALDHERNGELPEARMAWQVVARLDPQNPEIPKIIQTLNRGISNAVKKHYQDALEIYAKGDFAAAQRELLIVLRLAPDHQGAQEYLKKCLYQKEPAQYKVQRGDSYIKIATQLYNDPTKGYIIAYYNDLDPNKPLLVGKTLLVPTLDPQVIVPRVDIDAMLSRAKQALDQKAYDKAATIADKVLTEAPGNQQAQRIVDQAYLEKGRSLIARGDYLAALAELKKVNPSVKGRTAAINTARQFIQQQAVAEKLALAKSLMERKAYAGVINVTEEILTESPGQAVARFLFNAAHYASAKDLIEAGKDEDAIKDLKAIHQPYEDTDQLIIQVQGRLHSQAEKFYRQGVKHFLNEDLEMAIKAWQQTLALNPNHPKAAHDIKNAIELLDKWKGLEKDQ
jgi:tetratricopeptide (TPR) repeat protein